LRSSIQQLKIFVTIYLLKLSPLCHRCRDDREMALFDCGQLLGLSHISNATQALEEFDTFLFQIGESAQRSEAMI
jgi:hypothetical protein